MKQVRAIAMGFYNGTRVYPGQLFSVPNNLNGSWFEVEGVEPSSLRQRGRRRKTQEPEIEGSDEAKAPSDE